MMAMLGPARQTDRDVQILSGAVKLVLIIGMECTVLKVHRSAIANRMFASDHALGAGWVNIEHIVPQP